MGSNLKHNTLELTLLFDYYSELLTAKQRELFDLHYNQDLSLGEIAENEGISRQGVHDAIARAETVLTEFEAKTGCAARIRALELALDQITAAAEAIAAGGDAAALAAQILATVHAAKE